MHVGMFGKPFPDLLLERAVDRRDVTSPILPQIVLSGRGCISIGRFIEMADEVKNISRRVPCFNGSAGFCSEFMGNSSKSSVRLRPFRHQPLGAIEISCNKFKLLLRHPRKKGIDSPCCPLRAISSSKNRIKSSKLPAIVPNPIRTERGPVQFIR